MADPPYKIDAFDAKAYERWLTDSGAAILPTTNPYEVLRYTLPRDGKFDTFVIYQKKNGRMTWPGDTWKHYKAFAGNGHLILPDDPVERAVVRKKNNGTSKPKQKRVKLVARDGTDCWFCGQEMAEDDRTIEHLVPKHDGGGNGLTNLVLAHAMCNHYAADAPLAEKIDLRAQMTAKEYHDALGPPWLSLKQGKALMNP